MSARGGPALKPEALHYTAVGRAPLKSLACPSALSRLFQLAGHRQ